MQGNVHTPGNITGGFFQAQFDVMGAKLSAQILCHKIEKVEGELSRLSSQLLKVNNRINVAEEVARCRLLLEGILELAIYPPEHKSVEEALVMKEALLLQSIQEKDTLLLQKTLIQGELEYLTTELTQLSEDFPVRAVANSIDRTTQVVIAKKRECIP
jgi:hypothetical protein